MQTGKFRRYQITINNWTQEEYDIWWNLPCRYIIIGKEVGEQGTAHIHVYVEFESQRSFNAIRNVTPRGHVEVANGDSDANRNYIMKDGDFQEKGERSMTQKEKGDCEKRRFADAFANAVAGQLDKIDGDIMLRHYGQIKKIQKDHLPPVPDLPEVTGVWYYGTAGSGKTHKAIEDFPGAYRKLCNKWWDGYQDEDYVLIDDVDPAHACLVQHFKHWSDRYAFNAEIKGGAIRIRPKKIIFTSQYTIEECFRDKDQASVDAIKRRCKVVHITNWRLRYPQPQPAGLAAIQLPVTATMPPAPVAAPAQYAPAFNPPHQVINLDETAHSETVTDVTVMTETDDQPLQLSDLEVPSAPEEEFSLFGSELDDFEL